MYFILNRVDSHLFGGEDEWPLLQSRRRILNDAGDDDALEARIAVAVVDPVEVAGAAQPAALARVERRHQPLAVLAEGRGTHDGAVAEVALAVEVPRARHGLLPEAGSVARDKPHRRRLRRHQRHQPRQCRVPFHVLALHDDVHVALPVAKCHVDSASPPSF